MKKYIPVKSDSNVNFLEVECYYSLGGMNYFTGRAENRGYYLSVTPVERNRGMIGFTAFSGIKKLVLEVGRKSAKKEAEANALAENDMQELIDYVCTKNNLEVVEE